MGTVVEDLGAEATVVEEVATVAEDAEEGASLTEEGDFLYRGVHSVHPEIVAARQGIVRPGNINGSVTPELHNLGGMAAESPYTSRTRDADVAISNAEKQGPGGVVLRVPIGAPPTGVGWSREWSPDAYGQQELLLKGIRTDIEVFAR